MPSTRRASALRRAGAALVGVALLLGAAEGALRVLGPEPRIPHLHQVHEVTPDEPWLFALRPGAHLTVPGNPPIEYAINEHGFRDRPRTRAKPEGVYRVIVLGDSLALGWGAPREDTFPAQLEALLDGAPPAEVLNWSAGGYNPYNQSELFRARGAAFHPDLVLAQFCINDLNDPTHHYDGQVQGSVGEIPAAAYPNPARKLAPVPGPLLPFCTGWRLCQWIEDHRWAVRSPGAEEWWVPTYSPIRDLAGRPEARWIANRYGEIRDAARQGGARFAVVAFPYRAQVEGDASDRVQRQLVAIGRARGWETIDLVPVFRDAFRRDGRSLFADPWHPDAAGHRLAAEAIAREIERRGWRPRG